jgi:transposase
MSMLAISLQLSVSYGTVKSICKRYAREGIAGLEPKYDECGRKPKSTAAQAIQSTALDLRTQHSTWGSDRIRIDLVAQFGSDAPSVRTLQRWYRESRHSEPKMQHNTPRIGKATKVHNIWQVDAKEQLILQDKQVACYLTFTDEYSGIWLGSVVFPYHRICQVPLEEVLAGIISLFKQWGKAGSFRVDNGEPLGNPKMNSTPSLALWLIAMDVDMIWNTPRSPTQNAKVERTQGTSARWAEIHNCPNITILQQRLDAESIVLRSKLEVRRLNKQTRLQAYPEIETIPRPYDMTTFDVQRVYTFLATKKYVRKVSAVGIVMLYGQQFNIARCNANITVEIQFNSNTIAWEFYDKHTLLATKPALHLSADNIRNLKTSKPILKPQTTDPKKDK